MPSPRFLALILVGLFVATALTVRLVGGPWLDALALGWLAALLTAALAWGWGRVVERSVRSK